MPKHPFEYQTPSPEHISKIAFVRSAFGHAYNQIVKEVPACAERTLALRKLEEASMWANKAIVFDGERYL